MINTENYQPASLELHIAGIPDFVKKYGKAVKAHGGNYSHVRGHRSRRFVTVPNTAPGRELAQNILDDFGGPRSTIIIMRGIPNETALGNMRSWVTVTQGCNSIAGALAKYERKLGLSQVTAALERAEESARKAEAEEARRAKLADMTDVFAESGTFRDTVAGLLAAVKVGNEWLTDDEAKSIVVNAMSAAVRGTDDP